MQPTVTSGNGYVTLATGMITSWSMNAGSTSGDTVTMKVFRKVADPSTYQVVGHDGPRALNPGVVNTFPAGIPVKPGDVLGLGTPIGTVAAEPPCFFSVPGDSGRRSPGDLPDGASGDFTFSSSGRLNVSAVLDPANDFEFGKVKRNKKKGTATLTVNVPNPGELVLAGKGVKRAGASGAVVAKTVTGPGRAKLKVRATGKKKRKLNKTGKVKLKLKITYTPTGGDPSTQSRKQKLKKR